jgi:hypothetical protein
MRKIDILLSLVMLIGIMANASGKSNKSYVVTDKDTMACKDLTFSATTANVTLADGQQTQINKENVLAFSVNGKKYENMPVYIDGKATGNKSFLEFLSERNGLKLYKYTYLVDAGWSTGEMKKVTVLTVFKDNAYYVQVDKKNANTLLGYFDIDRTTIE